MTSKLLFISLALLASTVRASSLVTNPSSSSDNTISAPNGVLGLSSNSTNSDAIQSYSTDGAGLFSYSENSYGLMGMSAYGSSAWFGSAYSGNTSPTVVIQSVGHNTGGPDADLLQVQDENGGVLLRIDSAGVLHGSVTSSL